MVVEVSRDVLDLLESEAARAQPHECCGILFGKDRKVTKATPTANVHPQPHTHFEIDPQALVDAHRAARDGGPEVVGYYHSHPRGPAKPSEEDRSSAAGDGRIWAIVAPDAITWWQDTPNGFSSLPYKRA